MAFRYEKGSRAVHGTSRYFQDYQACVNVTYLADGHLWFETGWFDSLDGAKGRAFDIAEDLAREKMSGSVSVLDQSGSSVLRRYIKDGKVTNAE